MMDRLLLTGAAGGLATLLRPLLPNLARSVVLSDRVEVADPAPHESFTPCEMGDEAAVAEEACARCRLLVAAVRQAAFDRGDTAACIPEPTGALLVHLEDALPVGGPVDRSAAELGSPRRSAQSTQDAEGLEDLFADSYPVSQLRLHLRFRCFSVS